MWGSTSPLLWLHTDQHTGSERHKNTQSLRHVGKCLLRLLRITARPPTAIVYVFLFCYFSGICWWSHSKPAGRRPVFHHRLIYTFNYNYNEILFNYFYLLCICNFLNNNIFLKSIYDWPECKNVLSLVIVSLLFGQLNHSIICRWTDSAAAALVCNPLHFGCRNNKSFLWWLTQILMCCSCVTPSLSDTDSDVER